MSRIRRRLLPASILGAMLCVLPGSAAAQSGRGPRYAKLQMDFSFPNNRYSQQLDVASCIGG